MGEEFDRQQFAVRLRDSADEVRRSCLVELTEAYDGVDAASLDLVGLVAPSLDDPNAACQAAALHALGKYGAESARVLQQVEEKLQVTDDVVIAAACRAAAGIGGLAAKLLRKLLTLTTHGSAGVRAEAFAAVGSLDGASYVKEVTRGLDDESPRVVQAACRALATIGAAAKSAHPDVARVLVAQEPDSKIAALSFFVTVPDLCMAHGNEICGCLGDSDALVRAAAYMIFSTSGDVVAPLGKDAAKLLSSKSAAARCTAAAALSHLGEEAGVFATEVAQLLEDGFQESSTLAKSCRIPKQAVELRISKCAAALFLGRCGSEGFKFSNQVAGLLQDGNPEVRQAAIQALGEMGQEGVKHEGAIVKLLGDKDVNVVAAASLTLGRMAKTTGISNDVVADLVAKGFRSQHPNIRASAATALGMMGESAISYAKNLAKCLDDRCSLVRIAAMGALTSIGVKGQVYAVDISRQLMYPDAKVVMASMNSLMSMGPRGAAFVDDIAEHLANPDWEVREFAVKALGHFGEDIDMLIGALEQQADPIM